ncbi:hypothetical protein QQ41_03925 [Streptococcus equi subsp. zooepidemicus]|nr:hypothetical protein QQ41_03925 [Streptococcus equi subsp. zooepidemicus]
MLDKNLKKFFVLYNMFKMLDIVLKGIRYAYRKIYKKYRDTNNLSMAEFAKESGISKAYVSVLEKTEILVTEKKSFHLFRL